MEITPYVLGWLVSTILTGLLGYFGGKVKKLSSRDKAVEEGIRCLLRGEITRAYQRHVIDGRPMTLECRRQLDEIWKAYKGLDGNGTASAMYQELCEMQINV